MILATRLSPRERGFVVLTSTVVGLALGYQFLLEPFVSRFNELRNTLQTQTLQLEKNRRLIAEREKTQKRLAMVVSGLKMKGSEEEEIADFLSRVEQMAGQAALPLKGLRPRPATSLGPYRVFAVEVSAEGQMEQVTRFLEELQKSAQIVRVDRMQLAVKGGSSDLLEASLTLSILRLPS